MADTTNVLDWVGNFALAFNNQRPVFFNGKKIGYWQSTDSLCRGSVVLEVPVAQAGDPRSWTTKDDLWRDIPATTLCVAAGFKPVWATDAEIATAKAIAPAGTSALSLPAHMIGAALNNTGSVVKWVAIGGVGLVALYLILGRRR